MTISPDPTETTQVVVPSDSPSDIDEFLNSLGADFEYAPSVTVPPIAAEATDDDPDGDDEEDTGEEEPSSEPTVESVTINGQSVPLSEVQRLVEFDTYLKSNPDAARRMAESIAAPTGLPTVPTPTASAPSPDPVAFVPPTPPEALDLEDPSVKVMWDELVATRKAAWEATQSTAAATQQFAATQQQLTARQAEIDMRDAQAQFRHDHPNMTEDNIKDIRKLAASMNIVPGLLTSMPTPTEALHRAMEIAAWADSNTRPLMLDTSSAPPPTRSQTRKQRLSQISSAPGSAPVTDNPPRVRSDRDMINAFAQELSDSGFGR